MPQGQILTLVKRLLKYCMASRHNGFNASSWETLSRFLGLDRSKTCSAHPASHPFFLWRRGDLIVNYSCKKYKPDLFFLPELTFPQLHFILGKKKKKKKDPWQSVCLLGLLGHEKMNGKKRAGCLVWSKSPASISLDEHWELPPTSPQLLPPCAWIPCRHVCQYLA